MNQSVHRTLPHADPARQQRSSLFQVVPLDCRLLIWEYVLHRPHTRIERWRAVTFDDSSRLFDDFYADCFPYPMTTTGHDKTEKPLNVLLSCRQLYLEGLPIFYSTTFVFALPLDLLNFQLCVSPEGLSRVTSVIIAFGLTDWPDSGPFCPRVKNRHPGALQEWQGAILGLGKMGALRNLQIWLGHTQLRMPELERRPWPEHRGSVKRERNHSTLIGVFGTVNAPNFTLHLTWNPRDLLAQRNWPFKVELHTGNEMFHAIERLPQKTEPDFEGWWG